MYNYDQNWNGVNNFEVEKSCPKPSTLCWKPLESVDALESIALGHQEFNQPETRLQLQGSNKPKKWNLFFVALPSPNTKKKHPKWDLDKDFSAQSFIER